MFNSNLKKEAIKTLQNAGKEYEKQFEDTVRKMEELQKIRECSVEILNDLSHYISDLANSPIEYDTTIAQTTARCNRFNERIEELKDESQGINFQAGSTAGAGALAGVGVAAAAPSAAIAVAMTFGTASTGTAIASLSGAAAMNAALAWLGGCIGGRWCWNGWWYCSVGIGQSSGACYWCIGTFRKRMVGK